MTSPIPVIPFESVAERVAHFWNPLEYNPHKGLLAPTRSGKSYLIRHGLLSIVPDARTVVIDVKPNGEKTWDNWGNDVTELKPGFGKGDDGTFNYRIMLLPGERGKTQIKSLLDMLLIEGEVILIMDDSRKITAQYPSLGLSGHVDELLTVGAGIGISVILAANSTVWATSTLRDQCGAYFIGNMQNEDERTKFAKIIGLPKEYRPALQSLSQRQFVYSDQFEGEMTLAITSLPASAN